MMLYAQVVLGLPIEGPFDYFVPETFLKKIKVGCRVWVNFRNSKKLAYVVKTSSKSSIKNVKPVFDIIDEVPVLDKNLLLLAKNLSDYYCCSWGEAIEAALPESLRKGKRIEILSQPSSLSVSGKSQTLLVQGLSASRWDDYLSAIRECRAQNKSVLVLLPDIPSVLKAKEMIREKLNLEAKALYRKQADELGEWLKIKEALTNIVVGTRSAVFAPLKNLGLIIVDEEQSSVYKQEQVPHYHAREVALMRSNLEKAKLMLGSSAPSLESVYLARKNKIQYRLLPRPDNLAQVNVIDMKNLPLVGKKSQLILSRYLQDGICSVLNLGAKVLLFLNRKGFANFATCSSCAKVLKCPRCNMNLVYYFHKQSLSCRYCNFKMTPPKICPACNSGYIKYSGAGTEKIESEIARIFPQAKIEQLEAQEKIDLAAADIFIATSAVLGHLDYKFSLVGVLGIDNSLNYVDFRAAEKVFGLLIGLAALTDKQMMIQTSIPGHHCFRGLKDYNPDIFYDQELNDRKQLRFPPFSHFAFIKLRAKNEEKAKAAAYELFEKISRMKLPGGIKVISVNPGQPAKLRGNFYWAILLRANNPEALSKFLKINLKTLKHSGIIVTVDIDPL